MKTQANQVFLKPNAIAEPLIGNWYAWVQLISPITAGLNVKKRHIPIMQSFINSPLMHVAACKNPKMMGGPFINYGADRVEDVKNLLADTKIHQEKIVELADSIDDLNQMLGTRSKRILHGTFI